MGLSGDVVPQCIVEDASGFVGGGMVVSRMRNPACGGRSGRYLASAIAYLKTYEEAAFERLQEAVRRVIPRVESVFLRVKRTKRQFVETRYVSVEGRGVRIQETREAVGDELVFDMRGWEITAKDVSEGTLLAVGLLAVLISPRLSESGAFLMMWNKHFIRKPSAN